MSEVEAESMGSSSGSGARYDIGWISVFLALLSPNGDEGLVLHAVVKASDRTPA